MCSGVHRPEWDIGCVLLYHFVPQSLETGFLNWNTLVATTPQQPQVSVLYSIRVMDAQPIWPVS